MQQTGLPAGRWHRPGRLSFRGPTTPSQSGPALSARSARAEADLLAALADALRLRWTLADRRAEAALAATPPPEALRELLALSAGGCPRALEARLAELAQESPAVAAWVEGIAPLARDRPTMNATLSEALQRHAEA